MGESEPLMIAEISETLDLITDLVAKLDPKSPNQPIENGYLQPNSPHMLESMILPLEVRIPNI